MADKTHRGIIFRLLPNEEEQEHRLHGICGACRKVWNVFLGRNQKQYAESKENGTSAPFTK